MASQMVRLTCKLADHQQNISIPENPNNSTFNNSIKVNECLGPKTVLKDFPHQTEKSKISIKAKVKPSSISVKAKVKPNINGI